MSNHIFMFGKPLDPAGDPPAPDALSITGNLPSYQLDVNYEGRLQINNAVGKCKVEIVDGTYPASTYAFVDNGTKEVVVRFDAVNSEYPTTDVPNGDFELGDNGMWDKGPGWFINTSGDKLTGSYSATYAGNYGQSVLRGPMIPCAGGELVSATAPVQQGASAAGNAGATLQLLFFDEDRIQLPGSLGIAQGNPVYSGSGGAWNNSTVNTIFPSSARFVQWQIVGDRRKENKPLWIDDVYWNHSWVNQVTGDFEITLKVTDAENRVAYWTGPITYEDDPIISKAPVMYLKLDDAPTVNNTTPEPNSRTVVNYGDQTYPTAWVGPITAFTFLGVAPIIPDSSMTCLFCNSANAGPYYPSAGLPTEGPLQGRLTTGMTLGLIINRVLDGGIRHLITRDSDGGSGRWFQWRVNGSNLEFIRTLGDVQTVSVAHGMVSNQTYVLEVSYDIASGQVRMYRNGTLLIVSTIGAGLDFGSGGTGAPGLRIANRSPGGGEGAPGKYNAAYCLSGPTNDADALQRAQFYNLA